MSDEVKCNPHPDAPHGFCRNASHSANRYVCECESWTPPDVIQVCKEALEQPAQEPVISNEQYLDLLYEYCKLKADNERLREALEIVNSRYATMNFNDFTLIEEALASTPKQSLQAHDDELLEQCAKLCENCWDVDSAAANIRKLKVKQ